MDKEELDRLIAEITVRGLADADDAYEPVADDAFHIARAILNVLGRLLGLSFVLEVQTEVLEQASDWAKHHDPHRRADAVEIAEVANAGYFTDLIDDLSGKLPSGRA